MQTMVVQFGLATIPLAMRARSSLFTSGTTRGTSGSIRHARELSITMAPAPATTGAHRATPEPHAEQGNIYALVVRNGDVLDYDPVEHLPSRTC